MSAKDDMAQTVVARPAPAAMDWLRTMFMPLEMRPLIPLAEAVDALGMTEDELRYVCVTDNISVYDDPAFGELLTVNSFWALSKGLVAMRYPLRSDRQMLVLILGTMKKVKNLGRITPLSYSQRLENEIRRIMKMPEPDRTVRATAFWSAYNDADTLTDLLERYDTEETGRAMRLARRTTTMRLRMERQGGKKAISPEPGDGGPSASS